MRNLCRTPVNSKTTPLPPGYYNATMELNDDGTFTFVPTQVTTKLCFGFRGEIQLPLFMIWREYWHNNQVIFAKTLFTIG